MADLIPEDTLRYLYLQLGLSGSQIAEQFDCSDATVYGYLQKYGIPARQERCWTPEEDAILRQFYPRLGTQGVLQKLSRTKAAIANRVVVLTLTRQTITEYLVSECADELESLYVQKNLTERAIAQHFKISRHPVRDALEILGIPKRKGRGIGYYHPERKPTQEELERWLNADFKTLSEIAQSLGCDVNTVIAWAEDYDVQWDRSKWGNRLKYRGFVEPTPKELKYLYVKQEWRADQIAIHYGCSRGLITKLLRQAGIPSRESCWPTERLLCADGHLVRSGYEQVVDNWLFEHGLLHTYEPSVPFHTRIRADFLVGETFIEVWGVATDAYERRKTRKRRLYSLHNIRLIEIDYSDFLPTSDLRWQHKLGILLLKS